MCFFKQILEQYFSIFQVLKRYDYNDNIYHSLGEAHVDAIIDNLRVGHLADIAHHPPCPAPGVPVWSLRPHDLFRYSPQAPQCQLQPQLQVTGQEKGNKKILGYQC